MIEDGVTLREAPVLDEVSDSLVERYGQMAHTFEPRLIDHFLRMTDVLIAVVVLVLSLPLFLLITASLRLSGGPAIYRGARVGRAGMIFTMYKFRTLKRDAESRLGPYLGSELTQRTVNETTRVGKFLRASKLDELPQLINVIRGEMSLVGPRPIRPAFFEQLCVEIPDYWQRLVVRPGLTGFAQLRLTRDMTWTEKLAHDFEYIADRSVWLYAAIMLKTGVLIFTRPLAALLGIPRRWA